jgi:chromosome segregation ATPase
VTDVRVRIDRHVAAANQREAGADGTVTKLGPFSDAVLGLHEPLAARSETIDRLQNQIAEVESALGKVRCELEARNDELKGAAKRERAARDEVAQLRTALAASGERLQELAAAVADREKCVTEASVEMTEMQVWIRHLEARLVDRDKRRRGRWWSWRRS